MKQKSLLVVGLLALSGITGYLLSKASLVGRVGINLFYTQYKFLKVWWQGGLLIFAVWMILLFLQGWADRKYAPSAARLIHFVAIIAALTGLVFTYQDFRNTTTHRWLGERFHLGGYLFWIGWIIISVFYLMKKRETHTPDNFSSPKGTLPASDTSGQ